MTNTSQNAGHGVLSMYNFEVAAQKATEGKVDAVNTGHPLEIKLEAA